MGDALSIVRFSTQHFVQSLTLLNQHGCVTLTDDTLKCWGRNDAGQLGLGDTNDRGDQPGEMNDALPTVAF